MTPLEAVVSLARSHGLSVDEPVVRASDRRVDRVHG